MPTMTTPSKLDRDIAESLARSTPSRRPLYGHTSEATAYYVHDYPYGFRERTQIRYWLESKPKKGWRFVSQTMNPKTIRWNKPKASTYSEWGGAMYLDDQDHVQWTGIGPYSDERAIRDFVTSFPEAKNDLKKIVPAKIRFLKGRLSGDIFFTINNQKQPTTESDVARLNDELAAWEEIGALLG
jgi:hypothetical protein